MLIQIVEKVRWRI